MSDLELLDEVYFGQNKYTYASDQIFNHILKYTKGKDSPEIVADTEFEKSLRELEKVYKDFIGRKISIFIEDKESQYQGDKYSCYTFVSEISVQSSVRVDKDRIYFKGIDKPICVIYSYPMLIDNNVFTGRNLTGVLLHELGHSFDHVLPSITSLQICKTCLNIATKALIDLLYGKEPKVSKHDMSQMAMYKKNLVLSISKLFEFDSGWLRRFIKFIFVPTAFKENYISERFADSIASMYGYGKDLMEALKIMDENDDYTFTPSSKIAGFFVSMVAFIIILLDEHPGTGVRMKQQINYLEYEINNNNYPKPIKEDLKSQVKQLQILIEQYSKLKTKSYTVADFNRRYSNFMTSLFKEGDFFSTSILERKDFSYEMLDSIMKNIMKRG